MQALQKALMQQSFCSCLKKDEIQKQIARGQDLPGKEVSSNVVTGLGTPDPSTYMSFCFRKTSISSSFRAATAACSR